MAKTATYEGPWDSHGFSKKDLDADKAYHFPSGVPVEITDDIQEKLEATGEKFTFEEVADVEEAVDNAEANVEDPDNQPLTDESGGGEAVQTGDNVSTSSTAGTGAGVTGSTGTASTGRSKSTRSTR